MDKWAINRQSIARFVEILEKAERIDILKLSPKHLEKEGMAEKNFHGHKILVEGALRRTAGRRKSLPTLERYSIGMTVEWGSVSGPMA